MYRGLVTYTKYPNGLIPNTIGTAEAIITRWEMTDGVRDKKSILHSFYV